MDKQQLASAEASDERSERQLPAPTPKEVPCLVFPHGKGRKFQSFYNPCEPNNRSCIKSIPELQGKAYYHKSCHQGWLIVIGNVKDNAEYSVADATNLDDCFLWNPKSSETIRLPSLDQRYFMFDLVLSSPPTCNPDNDDGCTVFLIFRGLDGNGAVSSHKHILVFCRPGDKQWRTMELDHRSNPEGDDSEFVDSLLCFQDKLYALCMGENWHHFVVDKQIQFLRKFKLEVAKFPPLISGGERYNVYMEDWVESGNEIFKDFSSMTWVLLKSLGDHVIFLCTNMDKLDSESRKCYSTSSAYCSAADMGLERVEDNATTVVMPCLKLPTPWFLPTWIMMPTSVNSKPVEYMSRFNNNGGELEALKQWDFLNNPDSTEAFAKYLHPVDYIHFRVACKKNSIFLPALNRISASTRATATTYLSPWLISIFEDNEETICNIVDPMHNNDRYLMKLSDELLVGATIRFSKDGWLLLSDGKKAVFCYNPFTRAMISLPDLPGDCVLGGMSFSSVPTSRDCVVIAVCRWLRRVGDNTSELSFLVVIPAKSATGWTINRFIYDALTEPYTNNFIPCINNPVFYNGAFYCLDYNGVIGVFNMKGTSSWEVFPNSLKLYGGAHPSFLVECDESLLLVNLGQSGNKPNCKLTELYTFFLGMGVLFPLPKVWVEVKSLGKHALFISCASSFSAVAPPRSCMENKIYLPRLYRERILYFSLETRKYHCVGSNQHSSQDFHNTKERLNCTWIEPNWSHASIIHT
ncbi:hypothetical protein MKW98_027380 [Papaver atlanticum]|uniref:KIB1-4 beta-propeller domain-containing protein n=1 Tax=Papaver atlanticum TaxID=357466 RepID=A0AAD4TIM2_9MAGN|nr:hypothetical protein MKW98_027380 [Papaver atlanticum]